MHSDKIIAALNKQLNAELFSSYLYLSMSAYFESVSLDGFANWTKLQAEEEYTHGMKFYEFIGQLGGKVVLEAIGKPQTDWASALAVFENIYAHEQKVTSSINDIVDLAISEKNHAVNNFLQWFIKEQVEEEASVKVILDKLKLIGDHSNAIFMLDHHAAKRTK